MKPRKKVEPSTTSSIRVNAARLRKLRDSPHESTRSGVRGKRGPETAAPNDASTDAANDAANQAAMSKFFGRFSGFTSTQTVSGQTIAPANRTTKVVKEMPTAMTRRRKLTHSEDIREKHLRRNARLGITPAATQQAPVQEEEMPTVTTKRIRYPCSEAATERKRKRNRERLLIKWAAANQEAAEQAAAQLAITQHEQEKEQEMQMQMQFGSGSNVTEESGDRARATTELAINNHSTTAA